MQIINKSLAASMSYTAYKDLVKKLLSKGKSTGENQNDDFLNYTKLGVARMKRLDKKFKLSEKANETLKSLNKNQLWLVITEGWCGDAAHALPVLNAMAEVSDKIDLNIVLRDENDDLMNQFLTNGSKSIPKLIALDKQTKEIIATWGPRPSVVTKMVAVQKEKFGQLDTEFKKELQIWYNNDKGVTIENDLLELLCLTSNCI